jgi:hypothetical protein
MIAPILEGQSATLKLLEPLIIPQKGEGKADACDMACLQHLVLS